MNRIPDFPIILLGMHRSGTSLLTRCLAELGLFVGWKRQRNDEAVLFRRFNDHIFTLAGARWDHPEAVKELLADPDRMENLSSSLTEAMRSRHSFSFLGPRRFLRSRSLFGLTEPWGWKDPRNTYLLGLWQRVFPRARVIHLVRHGVDVAASLRVRHEARSRDHAAHSSRTPALLQSPPNPAISPRCATLSGGFTLWQEYLAQAREALSGLEAGDQVLEFGFEELLSSPLELLAKAASFSGLTPGDSLLKEVAARVSPEKGSRWKRDDELRAFARGVEAELAAEGYGD